MIVTSSSDTSYPRDVQTLVGLLAMRAEQWGGSRHFSFLRGNGMEEARLTFAQLHTRARAIGSQLQSRFQRGNRALLLFPPGLDFVAAFFGCLYGGLVAVPFSPPRRRRANPSLAAICQASDPAVVLTTTEHQTQAGEWYADVPDLLRSDWMVCDAIPDDRAQGWEDPQPDRHDLAFLQFTSGSTAEPKGVMLSHENLLQNLARIQGAFGSSDRSSAVFWLPLYHDMGLIGGVMQPIYCGGSCALMAPAVFLQRPRLWLEMISRRRATISGGPDFAYDLCVRKIPAAERHGLDLSCWELAFTGAEPIHGRTLERFAEAFGPCGFRREAFFPCYGLAEATLIVSGGPREMAPEVIAVDPAALASHRVQEVPVNGKPLHRIVACGHSMPGQRIAIVNPRTARVCRDGEVGEIWVCGPSVARGYWGRPAATAAAFDAYLQDTHQGPFLRTGDLGFLRGDQLFVTGRLKDLIIIRGRKYYPSDIERTVEQADAACRAGYGAAFSVLAEDQERLVVVQELEPRQRGVDAAAVLQAIRAAVADNHDLEIHAIVLVRAGTVPKTTSGKTRRQLCRQQYLRGELQTLIAWSASLPDAAPPSNADHQPLAAGHPTAGEIEAWLVQRIAQRLNCSGRDICTTTPFLDFGLGSLDAIEIVADLERHLNRPLSPTAVYNHPNVADLATWLASTPVPAPAIAPTPHETPREGDSSDLLRDVRQASEAELEAFICAELARSTASSARRRRAPKPR